MCYIGHIKLNPRQPSWPRWVPVKPNVEQGRGSFRAQAVSQKTRKKSTSAKASHKEPKKVAAASRSASKGRTVTKAPAAKSSKNKRSAMPNKTAKPAAKATVAKPVAAKPAVAKAPVAKAPAAKPAAPKAPVAAAPAKAPVAAAKPAVKPAAAAPKVEEKKVVTQRQGFKANEFVVYPAHGVGQILAIEEQEIAGAKLELFVINFIKDKMTLRVPTAKVANVGMRKLSEPA